MIFYGTLVRFDLSPEADTAIAFKIARSEARVLHAVLDVIRQGFACQIDDVGVIGLLARVAAASMNRPIPQTQPRRA